MAAPSMAAQGSIYDVPIAEINGPGDRQPAMIAAVVIPFVFAVISVVLRFSSRWISKASFGIDDWLMIPALTASLVTFGVSFWGISNGDGMYIGTATFGKLRTILLEIFVSELIYSIIIACVKCSILTLYLRIFPTRFVRTFATILGAITLGWLISNTAVVCLQCQPTAGFWDKTVPAECNVDLKAFLLAVAFVNVVTDLVILALPIFLCLRLQQSRVNRLLLVCVFATGFLVTIVSIVRLVAIFRMDVTDPVAALNITWSFVDVSTWTEVEQNIAIISGCLPCIKPVVSKMIPASLVPSPLRKTPTPGQTGSSTSKRLGKLDGQNLWMRVGSWRTRSRDYRVYNMSDLLRTDNAEPDSQVALGALVGNERTVTPPSGSKVYAERKFGSRVSEYDLEHGASPSSTRRDSTSGGGRQEQVVWKTHG